MSHFNSTHGMSSTSEYRSWLGMKQRCGNKNNHKYYRYGGRGISVCDRWKDSFQNFFFDMGPKPDPSFSIDRIENDGDYKPSNCRWASIKDQQNNTSKNHNLTLGEITKTIAQWAENLNMSEDVIFARKKLGWSDEEALTKPRHERKVKGKGVTREVRKSGSVRWKAYTYRNNKRIHIGCFVSEEEAIAARKDYES